MPAQMGAFRSPTGMRKPQLKAPGAAPKRPGRALANPMASPPGMSGMPPGGPSMGFKKGGAVKGKSKGKKKK